MPPKKKTKKTNTSGAAIGAVASLIAGERYSERGQKISNEQGLGGLLARASRDMYHYDLLQRVKGEDTAIQKMVKGLKKKGAKVTKVKGSQSYHVEFPNKKTKKKAKKETNGGGLEKR